ncbi:MAG TPA: hypothetical protein VME18_10990 [Acidobacteriaceae bacterium]|nr:hypothetical protein [Acidobacteriaceae bacterium]
MELIDRYLQAVRFWLPRRQQDDIVAELSEDIHAQVEERQAALGRPLTDIDVEELLRRRGSPVLVASRYLPQESLIGPLLFPIYRFVIVVVTICVAGSIGLSWLVALIIRSLGIVAGRPGVANPGALWSSLWVSLFCSAGVVTLIFAILERTEAKARLPRTWNPRTLPPLRPAHLIPRSSSVIEFAVSLCLLVWWGLNMASPLTLRFGALRVALAPGWTWIFLSILVFALGNTALSAVNLMRPWWTTRRVASRLSLDALGSVIFCGLLRANIVTGVAWPGATPEQAGAAVIGVNHWLAQMFPYAIAACLVIFAVNAWRLIRVKRRSSLDAVVA